MARRLGLVYALPAELREVYLELGIDLRRHNDSESWELPIPATLVVDRMRRVRLAFADIDYTKRLDPRFILQALDTIDALGGASAADRAARNASLVRG